ncbi:CatB-related O-acetyltransferase [Pleomorphovibrio marinus]|uniref:CatB-related O-acetyltransferase n=1 Tax=Pleomorphovibrio marinus TaxID=2164132 RepID=UPI000E0CB0DE|nr:CatB-related O-acetyltransferase [Pleomorphovibrio marinus]
MKKFLLNFYKNILALLKYSAKTDCIHWGNVGNNADECKIHEKTKIHGNHIIRDTEIGEGTYISKNASIYNTIIGKYCSIGPNLVSGWGLHPTNGVSTSPVFYSTDKQTGFTYSEKKIYKDKEKIIIGNDVFIGANVTIIDGVKIHDGAIIGAGAVVSKNIPPYAIAVGCPIKIIKYRYPKDIIDQLLEIKWWNKDEKTLRNVHKYFYDIEEFIKSENLDESTNISINK